MNGRSVLISGAGIAGSTLAYWLARRGFAPTVVERAGGSRSSGNPVDVRGEAVRVAERMGVLDEIRDAATRARRLTFVTASGRAVGSMPISAPRGGAADVEVPRTDLATILQRAVRDNAEFVFDDTITGLSQDRHGVDVTFERTSPRRFDLVVGTDGAHSLVRRLTFGPEQRFIRHLGLYVATLGLDRSATDPDAVVMHNAPGRSVAVHPVRGDATAAFLFRGAALPDLDHRDVERHKRIVRSVYADGGWQLPDLLARVSAADELYFDAVSRIRLPEWSRGRVALAGDAASAVTLFGEGSSLAMIGAATLAEALAEAPGDHETAFRDYERRHRATVRAKQRFGALAAAFLVPRSRTGIAVRDLGVRVAGQSRANRSQRNS